MTHKGTLHLPIGPVGAGKTTFAWQRCARGGGVFLDLDAWMVRLFGKDTRPTEDVIAWYLERRGRCRELLWDTSLDILTAGADVFLELGLVSRVERESFYARARDEDLHLRVYLIDAPRDVRRQRVLLRNQGAGEHTQIVPLAFFELACDAWEPLTDSEQSAASIIEIGGAKV